MAVNLAIKRAVLLTGTVVPNSVHTAYTDPAKRLREYVDSIRYYVRMFPHDDVYFLENSAYDLDNDPQFIHLRKDCRFECLRFPASANYAEGKGYQEFEMIDKAFASLKDRYDVFIKITGRYFIRNAASISGHKCPGLTIDLFHRSNTAATFIMCFTPHFYSSYLTGMYKEVNDTAGHYIEHVLYGRVISNNALKHCRLFPRTPRNEGISGSTGLSMRRDPVKMFARDILRVLLRLVGAKTFFY
jgi:hypothetical protein